jgi:hypothetical protein
MTDADRGLVFDASNQTVSECVRRWVENFAKASLAPRTYPNYRFRYGSISSLRGGPFVFEAAFYAQCL